MAKLLITFAFTIDNLFQIKVKLFLGPSESRDKVRQESSGACTVKKDVKGCADKPVEFE